MSKLSKGLLASIAKIDHFHSSFINKFFIPDPYKQSYPGYPQQGQSSYAPQQGFPPYAPPGPQPGFMPVPGAVPYGHVPPSMPYSENNSSDPIVKGFEFSDESIRRGFIRKVYSILTVQLAVTLGFIFLFGYHDGAREWATNHIEMFWLALILMFVTIIAISCCEGVRRTSPHNFIALSLFTLAESYMVAMSTMRFAREDVRCIYIELNTIIVIVGFFFQKVLLAIGITTAVCLGLTIFAFQTKWDFTMMGGILFIAVLLLMLFGLIAMFTRSSTVTLIYSCCGALLFGIYLICKFYFVNIYRYKKSYIRAPPEEDLYARGLQ